MNDYTTREHRTHENTTTRWRHNTGVHKKWEQINWLTTQQVSIHVYIYIYTSSENKTTQRLHNTWVYISENKKLWVSFAKEPYKRGYVLQKSPTQGLHNTWVRNMWEHINELTTQQMNTQELRTQQVTTQRVTTQRVSGQHITRLQVSARHVTINNTSQ